MTRTRRRLTWAASVLLALVLLGFIGLNVAVRQLRSEIEAALGPRASVGALNAGWTGLELLDLRIRGATGWPVDDELRARRVHVRPDLRSLFGGPWRIAAVQVEDGYLSAVRTRDGKTHVLPALFADRKSARKDDPKSAGTAGGPVVQIGRIDVDAASLDFFDSSVRQPALRLRVEQLDVRVEHLVLPALDTPFELKVGGIFKGPQRDGRIELDGHYTPATHDANVHARFSGVDLLALQPYLLKVADSGVRRGGLDLELRATVLNNKLKAPGTLTLTNLELASDGPLATFAGVPRKAALAAMTEKGRLDVKFTLEGRLDDPSFSLNENLATKVASGLAESLGVSLSGVVKGLGGVVRGLFGQ